MQRTPRPTVLLDLTPVDDDGFDLIFRTSVRYLQELRRQITDHELDGSHCVILVFDNAQPVAGRVANYLSGTEYESIGVTTAGLDDPSSESADAATLRVLCTRNHLRRFAALSRLYVTHPITFTVEVPPEKAQSFADTVSTLQNDSPKTSLGDFGRG